MAAGNFGSPVQLLILLAIVLLFFGGKRLRNLGGDLGGAIKGFKNSMASAETEKAHDDEKKPYQLNNEPPQILTPSAESEKNTLKHGS